MAQAYQHQSAQMTLREALAAYRRTNGLQEKFEAPSPRARTLMDRHDVLHVVFGLDTSLRHEALVDLWTVFGTTARFSAMMDYLRLPEERAILAEIGWWRVAATTIKAIPDAFRVASAAKRLRRKWPWREHEQFLDRRLDEVRRDFAVALLT
jgi:hypothetical protein